MVCTTHDNPAVAAGHSADPGRWLGILDELMLRAWSRFRRVEPPRRARVFALGPGGSTHRSAPATAAGTRSQPPGPRAGHPHALSPLAAGRRQEASNRPRRPSAPAPRRPHPGPRQPGRGATGPGPPRPAGLGLRRCARTPRVRCPGPAGPAGLRPGPRPPRTSYGPCAQTARPPTDPNRHSAVSDPFRSPTAEKHQVTAVHPIVDLRGGTSQAW